MSIFNYMYTYTHTECMISCMDVMHVCMYVCMLARVYVTRSPKSRKKASLNLDPRKRLRA